MPPSDTWPACLCREALSFTVVLLVASIPIAIEIVCTATLALGSRQLSAHGAIVTRLIAIEEMAGMNMLCSDKTGTLTLNKMVIQVRIDLHPVLLLVHPLGFSCAVGLQLCCLHALCHHLVGLQPIPISGFHTM
jgi:magnesium-transporting ATPase (P-type)